MVTMDATYNRTLLTQTQLSHFLEKVSICHLFAADQWFHPLITLKYSLDVILWYRKRT
jgi:ethanolamine utilization protein EutP (predicted NTPase)